MKENSVVVIPIEKYEELLDIETRVNVVVERIVHDKYIKTEDVLWILGTELAVETAMEIREKEEKERKEYLEKYGESEAEE